MKIFKYPIPNESEEVIFSLEIPEGSDILRVGLDPQEQACIWCLVSEQLDAERRYFRVVATGEQIVSMKNKRYIGTWNEGPFVWHLFELFKEEKSA